MGIGAQFGGKYFCHDVRAPACRPAAAALALAGPTQHQPLMWSHLRHTVRCLSPPQVRVVRLPRHGASCPVGIGVSCSADRQAAASPSGVTPN